MSNKLIGYDNKLWRVEQEFSYTGEDQPFTLEPGTYLFICEGAHGGKGARNIKEYGGITYGEITLDETTTFHAVVGSDGADCNMDYTLCTGGFNGGAHGGMSYSSSYSHGPGGGGATDIRLLPYDATEYPTYDDTGNITFPSNGVETLHDVDWTDEETPRPKYIPDTSTETPILIFCNSQNRSNNQMGSAAVQPAYPWQYQPGRLYSFKIYESNVLSANMLPCYRISDNSKGVYDTIRQSFHPIELNQGNIVLGNDVTNDTDMPNEYQQVEYLDNIMHGTNNGQMINTGYFHTRYTKIVFDGMVYSNNWDEYGCIFGAQNDDNDSKFEIFTKWQRSYIMRYFRAVEIPTGAIISTSYSLNRRMIIEADENCKITYVDNDESVTLLNSYTGEHVYDITAHEYTPLEYIYAIGSSNSGYFNTGYIPKANTKIETEVVCFENTIQAYEIIFGARNNSYQNNAFVFFSRFNNNNIPVYNRSGVETQGTDFLYNEKIKIVCYQDKAEWFFGNSETPYGSITTTGTVNDCICPLLINTSNGATSNSVSSEGSWNRFKLYTFNIYESYAGYVYDQYQPVEYIESDGTQYIDTGDTHNPDDWYWLNCTLLKGLDRQQVVFGSYDDRSGGQYNQVSFYMHNKDMYQYTFGIGTNSSIQYVDNYQNAIYDKPINLFLFKGTVNVHDDNNYTFQFAMNNTLSLEDVAGTTPIALFAKQIKRENGAIEIESMSKMRFHEMIIWKNHTLSDSDRNNPLYIKHHYCPVRRISDGKLGIFDIVTHTFYTSPVGNDFIAGEDRHDINLGEGYCEPQTFFTKQREYIPARRNSDNVAGLFDTVNNTFITSTGGGIWLQGPPKTDHPSLNSRIMVAAGAGGGNHQSDTTDSWTNDGYSHGGGPYGSCSPGYSTGPDGFCDTWPTQTDGYAFGYGCYPTKRTTLNAFSAEGCGGGGGGWYSGYASIPHNQNSTNMTKQGGGGSSYVLTASSYKPNGYDPDPKYYFTKVSLHGAQAMGDLFSNNPLDWNNGRVYICKLEENIKTGDIIVYPCTGNAVSHDLPAGKYKLKVWGGDGGSRGRTSHCVKGGYSEGVINTQTDHMIYVYTGGSGGPRANVGYTDAYANTMAAANLSSLKFNGGKSIQNCARIESSSGGGTDIRFDVDDLYHRVIVAGGAGSEGMTGSVAGAGGGEVGGYQTGASYGTNNGPGTQSSGYALGEGGPGYYQSYGYGGCGGGGWYGGYGTTPNGGSDDDRAGSGGSGFVLTADTPASSLPNGYGCNEEEYYLTEATTVQGGNHLPMWHTKTQIEVISIAARCICRDADGYKYYDKENDIWTLLENQSITPETFKTYGSTITTDNGLLDEYYVYAYDANEQTNAISLNVIPNSQTIRIQLDVDIPVSEMILDDTYEKESFQVYHDTIRVKQEDKSYKTALEIHADHLLNDDNVYKAYVCQIYGSPGKTSNTYIKLDSKGRRIFQHKYFDIDTGELVTEERTMELKDPEDYRGEDGTIQTAQWLLPVGSAYNIPYDYNMNVVDNDIINIWNGVVAEHDRTVFFALGCQIQTVNAETGAVSTSYQLIIKAMNLVDQTVYSICRIPWRTVYSINDTMFIGKMLVDDKYFYLCMQASKDSSVAYQQSLVRIHRNDFSVSMSSTSGEALFAYGHMEWYNETHILLQGPTSYLLYDTARNTWNKTSHLINGTSTSSVQDWALGKTQIVSTCVRSNAKSVAICDRETFQLIKIITLPNAATNPRVCYDGNGKFYIATQYYLYEYDEETSEITNTINLSIMPYPNTVTYCNGAVIVTQYSNDSNEGERRLIVYRTDIDQYTSIYMPWGVRWSQQYDYCYIPLAIQGKFFYVKNSTLILDYSKYAKYKFGPHRNRHTVVLNQSNDDIFTYDSRFVSVLENCIKVHDGNIEYPLNGYDTNHITRTNRISKEDYRYLLGSTSITNEEGD